MSDYTPAVNRAIDAFMATNELLAAFGALLDVEEVARTLYEHETREAHERTGSTMRTWESASEGRKAPFHSRARAVIAATLGNHR